MTENRETDTTAHVANLLQQIRDGHSDSVQALLEASMRRLQILAKRISGNLPGVKRWEQTDDLVQNSMIRLWKAISKSRPPTPLDYYRLASAIIRRELIDLSRHYFGAEGMGANMVRTAHALDSQSPSPVELESEQTYEPSSLAIWTEFHTYIDSLDDETRALFDLLWYQDLTLTQAAELLGSSERTIRRRWKLARVALYETVIKPGAEGNDAEATDHTQ
jgi:RNA polymerase sigma-70 factor (ECF subfamily)